MSLRKTVGPAVVAVLVVSAPVDGRQDRAPYAVLGTIPDRVDGQMLRTFAYDQAGARLYAGSDRGLFWVDLAGPARDLRLKGPMFRKDIRKIEFAENLGRLFYATDQEVGYVDVRTGGEPMRLRIRLVAHDIAYEPTARELYVAARDPYLMVFDAPSGEFGLRVSLPGWYATSLEAAPGRVYLHVSPNTGFSVVDGASHRVSAWPVKGVVAPAYLEADPEGQYLFLSYDRYIAAVDAKTGTVLGRVVAPYAPSIAFDPGSRLLIATWNDDPPPTKITAFRVGPEGLTAVAHLSNPRIGDVGVEPMHRGFVQRGTSALILWAFREPEGLSAGSRSPLFPARAPGRPSGR